MNKAIILNYAISAVEVAVLPDELFKDEESGRDNSERIEQYLSEELGFNLSEIYYMVTEGPCPVYRWCEDYPFTEL